MDMRSFALDYEIMLMGFTRRFVQDLKNIEHGYRAVSTEISSASWASRPWYHRYVDNVMRLTSALQ
jgi:cardiolipin synthase